ncbi:fasciclin domain-containing protein [Lentibacter sp.]|uniref:fasciclin domain-containing protein n=1 Tax=Lentibacter sp. TaxID=2024994 RepID=UPI003F6A9D6E
MKTSLKAALAACFVALSAPLAMADGHGKQTIVEIAAADDRFSTLVAAVTAAGLADTLSSKGPFTVYAPVNDAFAALPEGTVETLLKPENKDQLTNVLLYHVDDRKLMASGIPHGSNYFKPVLASERLCITKNASGVSIADGTGEMANVIIADIKASNGVIHVIDKVLLPGTRPACH